MSQTENNFFLEYIQILTSLNLFCLYYIILVVARTLAPPPLRHTGVMPLHPANLFEGCYIFVASVSAWWVLLFTKMSWRRMAAIARLLFFWGLRYLANVV